MTDCLERALALAERDRWAGPTRSPSSARCSSRRRSGRRGLRREAGGPHGEIVALDAAGERARGATLYVTMEPCAHHGHDAAVRRRDRRAGVARVVAGVARPEPGGGAAGSSGSRAAGVEVVLEDSFAARVQNEAWRTWVSQGGRS